MYIFDKLSQYSIKNLKLQKCSFFNHSSLLILTKFVFILSLLLFRTNTCHLPQCSSDFRRCNMVKCPKSKVPRSKGCRRCSRSCARTWRRPCASRPPTTPTCSSSRERGSLCRRTSASSPSSPRALPTCLPLVLPIFLPASSSPTQASAPSAASSASSTPACCPSRRGRRRC